MPKCRGWMLWGMVIGYTTVAYPALDPFRTEALTTPGPQLYWTGSTAGLTVDTHQISQHLQALPCHPLTLAEVTDFALSQNPTTRFAWAQAKIAAANVGEAKSAYFPQVTVGVADQYGATLFTDNSNSNNTFGPNASISFLLLDFGNRANTVKAAKYALIAANLSQNNAIQQLIVDVEQSYYEVLGEQALLAANQESLLEANTSLQASQALRQQGLATIGDVYQAQASKAQSQLNVQQAQSNYKVAKGALAVLMGVPPDASFSLVPLTQKPSTPALKQHMGQLLATAIQRRPDLLAQEASVRSAQATLAATRAATRPQLQVGASVYPQTSDTGTVTATSVNVSLSFPLFTGFSHTYQVRAAQANLLAQQASRDQLLQQVQLDVWQAYYALQTAAANIETTAVFYKSSLQASNQSLGQFKAGVGDILSVLTTQSSLANARVESIQARLNWYIALAELAKALGTLYAC
ncbi:MAG: TolC family protein [Gammaproteobacteria bacterium]